MATVTVLGRCGAYPEAGGAGRGLLLQADGGAVLLGCGPGVLSRLPYSLSARDPLLAVLLPDLRPDHCSDLWVLGSWAAAAARAGARRGLLPVYAYAHPTGEWQRLQRPGVLDVRRFGAADTVVVGPWRFTFAAVEHPWPGAAVRAEAHGGGQCALFTLGAPSADLAVLGAGVDVLLVETGGPQQTGDEGLEGGMPAAEAGRLARHCGVRRLLLSHLDPGEDPEALRCAAAAVFPPSGLALESRTYPLG